MRYENWDVIIFPRDSHIPVQEFRTACYATQNEHGRPVHMLTCYITSLPPMTPFRISIHSWADHEKPTTLIESLRKASQRVVYAIQVFVDGVRVFHNFYELSSKWPQEIVNGKPFTILPEQPSSQPRPSLNFPFFHQNILMRSSWEACDDLGRIKILLSEQLVGKSATSSNLELGVGNDLVYFSFQHAPRDVLEQACIAWPVRNPLYLPYPSHTGPLARPAPSLKTWKPSNSNFKAQSKSPRPNFSRAPFSQSQYPEPNIKRRPDAMSQPSVFPKPPPVTPWDGVGPFHTNNLYEDATTVDSWSNHPSNSGGDLGMSDIMFSSSFVPKADAWKTPTTKPECDEDKSKSSDTRITNSSRQQIVVYFNEDQFGQLVETLSPKKDDIDGPSGQDRERMKPTTAAPQPPKMGAISVPMDSRLSAAAPALKASYSDLQPHLQYVSDRLMSAKQNDGRRKHKDGKYLPMRSSQSVSGKENTIPSEQRMPPPYSFDTRYPTPHPALQGPVWGHFSQKMSLSFSDSDIEMRNASSALSSLTRNEKEQQQQQQPVSTSVRKSPAPVLAVSGNVKSRKEGLELGTPGLSDFQIRHDQSLWPTPKMQQDKPQSQKTPFNSPATEGVHSSFGARSGMGTGLVAEPKTTFVPGHRSAMNSLEKIEAECYHALGEDLGIFETESGGGGMGMGTELGGEMRTYDGGLEEFESSVTKRKRQGTIGGERGRSPIAKMVREGLGDGGMSGGMGLGASMVVEEQKPRLRGGDEEEK
ncbi:hypothetical protein B0J11DRAFT_587874 [Dendryphion nanum]|uniref:Uncharacterized protein n=1 Tax=Dendryphion nanum TaxID=256645 RepID=A0A9P9EK09_9PLEO|nr:hypothetical protein B0J11DRAFT_587874 [Dendryphion nanum]